MLKYLWMSSASAVLSIVLGAAAAQAQDVTPGAYALKSDNGNYLARCAGCVPGGAYADNAGVNEGSRAKSWARWALSKRPNGRWVLQSDTGRFLARCSGCGPGTYADSAFVHEASPDAPWAQWALERRANGRWVLKSDSGKYLARCNNCFTGAKPDNAFVHETNPDAPWAQWTLESLDAPAVTATPVAPPAAPATPSTPVTPRYTITDVVNLGPVPSKPAPVRNFSPNMTPARALAMIQRLGEAKQGWVDLPRSEESHAIGNHINGMARVGPYWIVNYTDTGRKTGRLLYVKPGSGYKVYDVDNVGGGDNYLAGMDGDGPVLAYTTTSPSVRFLKMPPDGPPIPLPDFTYGGDTTFGRVGLASDPDLRNFVLMTKNKDGAIEIREGVPGNWTHRGNLSDAFAASWAAGEEESRPLVYMGNDVYAAFVLMPGDGPYSFSFVVFSLQGAGAERKVVPYGGRSVTLLNSVPPLGELDPGVRGYASFRWAGTVVFNGTQLEICASPRELNNGYNGDYSCWTTR